MKYLNAEQIAWCDAHADEALILLKTLASIPAPSHHEDRRANFVLSWLKAQGAEGVYIDAAKNVVLPIGGKAGKSYTAIMAHTDVVFPDTEDFIVREEGGRLYAPGVGDDTANLVALMMAAKYVIESGMKVKNGILFVANSCEEGLGNLKGSKQIFRDYEGRISEMVSIDGGLTAIVNRAVGSVRRKITIRAQGGHSYGAFGNTNAIVQMARLITLLYEKQPPKKAKTTYNAGVIEGGTTVNSICAECSLLYEFRSEDRECLQEMENFYLETVEKLRAEGVSISDEIIGVRPCGGDVDEEAQRALSGRMAEIMRAHTGNEITFSAGSTDANTALSAGVPAVTIGAVAGNGAHTRGEWIECASLLKGQKIALNAVIDLCDA